MTVGETLYTGKSSFDYPSAGVPCPGCMVVLTLRGDGIPHAEREALRQNNRGLGFRLSRSTEPEAIE